MTSRKRKPICYPLAYTPYEIVEKTITDYELAEGITAVYGKKKKTQTIQTTKNSQQEAD